MICEPGAVVLVPFPFVDTAVSKWRPSLVLSAEAFNDAEQQSVLAMITTAAASRWRSDQPIEDWPTAGLRTPCVVRMKLFTLENRLLTRKIGRLSDRDWKAVQAVVSAILPFRRDP